MSMFHKFFCLIDCIAIVISFIGVVIVIRCMFYCIKRYVLYYKGIDTSLSTVTFPQLSNEGELSPSEIVEKNRLKDRINKFARDTFNMVKSNDYLNERKEGIIDEDFKQEMKILSDIYISLDKMKITNSAQLEEVDFLFNNGKLRSNLEVKKFYKEKEMKEIENIYKNTGFIKDIAETYHEAELSGKLVIGLSLIFISIPYFMYKLIFAPYYETGNMRWTLNDLISFIISIFKITFNPHYDEDFDWSPYIYHGNHFFFCCSLIFSILISFLIGGGCKLTNDWICNTKLKNIYNKAGVKKKPDILLGVNTASYLYVLHKLLKKRK